jgi:hypothetical protein
MKDRRDRREKTLSSHNVRWMKDRRDKTLSSHNVRWMKDRKDWRETARDYVKVSSKGRRSLAYCTEVEMCRRLMPGVGNWRELM